MSTLAGAFNGLVAYAITKDLDGKNGWLAWRWIFLIEGVLPIGASFIVLALLPSSPSEVRFGFTPKEKEELIRRSERAHNTSESRLDVKKIHTVMLNVQFWLYTTIYCASHFCLSSLNNFLPDIIQVCGQHSLNLAVSILIQDG